MARLVEGIFFSAICSLLLCSCGQKEDNGQGRYVETEVELSEPIGQFTGMVQEGKNIRLVEGSGSDLLSEDGGGSFSAVNNRFADTLQELNVIGMAVSPEGSRAVAWVSGGQWGCTLYAEDGTETAVSGINDTQIIYPYYCGGSFYISQSDRVYSLDTSGGTKLLLDGVGSDEPCYLASDGKLLYVAYASSLVIYDLRQGTVAGQDAVMEKFLKDAFNSRAYNPYGAPYGALLYPEGDEVYMLDGSGIYRHTLYGEDMEKLVDGGTSSIGAFSREYVGMAVTEGDSPHFLVGYADGRLMRYAYDKDAPPLVTLRVYSLYESDNIRLLIREFRKAHPEITVDYEIGYKEALGMTVDDALKNVATQMAAGTAADIFVMDDLPYSAYVEKGALMDLSQLREEMTQEQYFLSVADGFAGEDGIYTIPLSFAIPILAGKSEDLQRLETLGDLAQCLGEARENQWASGSIINMYNRGYKTLTLLAESCQGAWVTAEGGLNAEAVKEFLTLGMQIYGLQIEGVDEEDVAWHTTWPKPGIGAEWEYPTKSTVTRRFGCYNGSAQHAGFDLLCGYPEQPFYAGYLSSMGGDFPYFSVVQDVLGFDYCSMPGQMYGACLALDMMSVNKATEFPEECYRFLEYAFSEEFQGNAALDGTPVNRGGYRQRKENYETFPRNEKTRDGRTVEIPAFVPSEEIFAKFESLIENVDGVNYCEAKVYDTVMEGSEKVVAGQCTVDEAVAEIEQKLKLYLAE